MVLREIADREAAQEQTDTPRVGYQGEPGAYGEVAAAAQGGMPHGFASFEKVLEALQKGTVDEAVLPLAGTAEFPVRLWVLGADAARLQQLAPARDVQVISLGQPAAHAARHAGKAGAEPVVKSLPHATARKPQTVVEVGPFRVGAGARA